MASAFGHAFTALVFSTGVPKKWRSWKLWILAIICSIIPDADIIAFNFGIPYEHMFGHRGFTHSIFFAVVFAVLLINIFHRNKKSFGLFFFYFTCTISHGIIDAFTNRGRGIAFFAPFSDERYFFPDPLRVIKTSPLNPEQFFSDWGIQVLKSEAIYIGIPFIFLLIIILIFRRR